MQMSKDLQIHQSLIGTRTFRIKEWNFVVVIELASCSGIPQFVIKQKLLFFFWLRQGRSFFFFSFLMISLSLH